MEVVGRNMLVVVVLFVTADSVSGQKVQREGVAKLVLQVVEQELDGCHLVFLTTDLYSPLLATVLR